MRRAGLCLALACIAAALGIPGRGVRAGKRGGEAQDRARARRRRRERRGAHGRPRGARGTARAFRLHRRHQRGRARRGRLRSRRLAREDEDDLRRDRLGEDVRRLRRARRRELSPQAARRPLLFRARVRREARRASLPRRRRRGREVQSLLQPAREGGPRRPGHRGASAAARAHRDRHRHRRARGAAPRQPRRRHAREHGRARRHRARHPRGPETRRRRAGGQRSGGGGPRSLRRRSGDRRERGLRAPEIRGGDGRGERGRAGGEPADRAERDQVALAPRAAGRLPEARAGKHRQRGLRAPDRGRASGPRGRPGGLRPVARAVAAAGGIPPLARTRSPGALATSGDRRDPRGADALHQPARASREHPPARGRTARHQGARRGPGPRLQPRRSAQPRLFDPARARQDGAQAHADREALGPGLPALRVEPLVRLQPRVSLQPARPVSQVVDQFAGCGVARRLPAGKRPVPLHRVLPAVRRAPARLRARIRFRRARARGNLPGRRPAGRVPPARLARGVGRGREPGGVRAGERRLAGAASARHARHRPGAGAGAFVAARRGGRHRRDRHAGFRVLPHARLSRGLELLRSAKRLRRSAQVRARRARLGGAWSLGNFTLLGSLEGGKATHGSLPLGDTFSLGGQRRLSAFAPGQILGEEYGLGTMQVQWRLLTQPTPLLGISLFGGLSFETGRMRGLITEPNLTGRLSSLGVYLAANTPLGPMYFGYADTSRRPGRLYLFIGTP